MAATTGAGAPEALAPLRAASDDIKKATATAAVTVVASSWTPFSLGSLLLAASILLFVALPAALVYLERNGQKRRQNNKRPTRTTLAWPQATAANNAARPSKSAAAAPPPAGARVNNSALYSSRTNRRVLSIKVRSGTMYEGMSFDQAAPQAVLAAKQVLQRAAVEPERRNKLAAGMAKSRCDCCTASSSSRSAGAGQPQAILRYSVAAVKGCVQLLVELLELGAAEADETTLGIIRPGPQQAAPRWPRADDSARNSIGGRPASSPQDASREAPWTLANTNNDDVITRYLLLPSSISGAAQAAVPVLHVQLEEAVTMEEALGSMIQQALAAPQAADAASAGSGLQDLQCYVDPVAVHEGCRTLTVHTRQQAAAAAAGLPQLRLVVAGLEPDRDGSGYSSTVIIDQRYTMAELQESGGVVRLELPSIQHGGSSGVRLLNVYVMAAAAAEAGSEERVVASLPVLWLPSEAAAAEVDSLFDSMELELEALEGDDVRSSSTFDATACSVYHRHFAPFASDLVAALAAAAGSGAGMQQLASAEALELRQHVATFLAQQGMPAWLELMLASGSGGALRRGGWLSGASLTDAVAATARLSAAVPTAAAEVAQMVHHAAAIAAQRITLHTVAAAAAGGLTSCLSRLNHVMGADFVEPGEVIWGFGAATEAAYAAYKNGAAVADGLDRNARLLDVGMRCSAVKNTLMSSAPVHIKALAASWALTPLLPVVAAMWRRDWYTRHRDGMMLAYALHCVLVYAILPATAWEGPLGHSVWWASTLADFMVCCWFLPLAHRMRLRWQMVQTCALVLVGVIVSFVRLAHFSLPLCAAWGAGATTSLLVGYATELPWRKAFVLQRQRELLQLQQQQQRQREVESAAGGSSSLEGGKKSAAHADDSAEGFASRSQ